MSSCEFRALTCEVSYPQSCTLLVATSAGVSNGSDRVYEEEKRKKKTTLQLHLHLHLGRARTGSPQSMLDVLPVQHVPPPCLVPRLES